MMETKNTSERVLENRDGTLIRINPREDDVPSGEIGLPFSAAEGIQKICGCAEGAKHRA